MRRAPRLTLELSRFNGQVALPGSGRHLARCLLVSAINQAALDGSGPCLVP